MKLDGDELLKIHYKSFCFIRILQQVAPPDQKVGEVDTLLRQTSSDLLHKLTKQMHQSDLEGCVKFCWGFGGMGVPL